MENLLETFGGASVGIFCLFEVFEVGFDVEASEEVVGEGEAPL